MKLELPSGIRSLLIETCSSLKGSSRRLFMARTVEALGHGGQRFAQRELGWNRSTIRKGMHELRTGILCCDAFALRGEKPCEVLLPSLLNDIREIVDGQSQTDPQFRNTRLYSRLTAEEVRRQLIAQKGYADTQLPKAQTIGKKLNLLGYYPKKVKKSLPKKRYRQPMLSLTN